MLELRRYNAASSPTGIAELYFHVYTQPADAVANDETPRMADCEGLCDSLDTVAEPMRRKEVDTCWRRMFVTQPPCTILYVAARSAYGEIHAFTVRHAEGITLGKLKDVIEAAQSSWAPIGTSTFRRWDARGECYLNTRDNDS